MSEQLQTRRKSNSGAARRFWILTSYGIAAAGLFWALHDIRFADWLRSVSQMNWRWAIVAAALQLLAYVVVAWEWQLLLRPVGVVSLRRLTQSVFAGRFANDVLPVQLGYFVRIFLVERWLRTGFASLIPSLLVERLWDGLWLAIGICSMAFLVPLSPELLRARNILAMVVGTGIAMVAVIIFRQRGKSGTSLNKTFFRWKWLHKFVDSIQRMSEGVHQIGTSHLLPAVLSLAFLKLFIQALSFYAMLWAYGFRFPFWIGLAVFLIAYLGICVPSTPASAGVFQVCSIAGLQTFGIHKTDAAGFSLVAFVVLTVPLAIAGFFAFAQSGMTLRGLRKDARDWKKEGMK